MYFRFKICFVKKDTVLFTSPTILLITLVGSVKFCPRQNKLRFEGIKEHQNESWEDCENKIYDFMIRKQTWNGQWKRFHRFIEQEHQTRKKYKNRPRLKVAQVSFFKDKINILKNCKKLKNTRFFILEDFSRQKAAISKEKWQEVLVIGKKGWYHI